MGIEPVARTHATHAVGFGIADSLALWLFALALALLLGAGLEDLPDYNSADAYLVAEPTQFMTLWATTLQTFYLQQRSVTWIRFLLMLFRAPLMLRISASIPTAVLDPWGIVRASVGSLFPVARRCPLITQLVRNTVLLTSSLSALLKRKVREAYISIQMEKKFDSDQI